ncbi:MAG: ABC transporter ATP-binding protein [Candidatus Brocadia sp. AMX2]|uniref:Maltose transport system ATP-binding protein n=1 Tax=Candidatus Brocadia sinica JPN1 TaxID=1197129 RepID=A0ABQ0JS90_9BACT|nr:MULTISPECIES: ABC transporter ATP-binding protein [Brocadia]MBC6933126.1 ABC transporter ATP-binding protein [Candidatus Brocadia sp.]MBL1168394.1 ABC transporter ATP-binding protein [Candidatus Brocadia sp. AMX1]NOG43198.1 ABC transporter ATP-binding protein [Planctomycetota bacterium]GIK12433.1 MAG: ABC transporter ATP-binding protein [Candidatus Brocadia sinica]KAA0242854.1 MAG: ABC transporter ATP-binding protein [Candidatus Brocadia sp. AMX2]
MRIRLQDLTKRYRHTIAVNNLNLDIQSGEFLVVLGSSGSGKSTTLNMIAGLETPASGYIFFNEHIVNQIPPGKRDVALVFQNYALYPHMKVYDNIAFPLRIRKEKEMQQKIIRTAKMLELNVLLQKYPKELSGGEKQRVALARALVRNPQVFLMDEPLSNLDARLRLSARGELKKLQRNRNITTVYVTHDQIEALTLGDRIAIMDKGRLQQIGTPDEIYQKPQNTFVASFVGTPPMNMAQINKLSTHSFTLGEILIEYPTFFPNKNNLILGIRPEKLIVVQADLSSEKETNIPFTIPCTVEHTEYLGHESIIHVKITQDITWYVKTFVEGIKISDRVNLQFSPDTIHWFDPITKTRIE